MFAPTSSGKTFVAELAAVKQVLAGRKAVFLVPTKALAEEQHAHLSRTYAPLGMRTAIATRERVRDDADIAAGAFDLAVMVYEKFKAFLAVVPEMLSRTGVVVVDELQILGDPERGGLVDLLLAKILAAPQPVQLVCLSAVLGENSRLASWLRSELLVWRQRPVELREGALVLPDGAFIYREFNSGREEKEDLLHQGDRRAEAVQPDAESFNFPAVAAATQELVRRGEQVLIFVPTRHLSRQWAYQLSRTLDLPAQGAGAPDPATLESLAAELRNHEESHSREILAQCFERAVGVHNADLPQDLRGLVERQFNSGTLRVLVATSTLAQGVNLSCRNVISVPVMVGEDAVTGATGFVPLSRQRFRNQGGRGGRLSSGEPFGRSIIVAEDERDASHIMREFVFADPEPLDAPIRQADIARFALDLVGCEAAADFAALRAMMISTYTGTIAWSIRPEHLNAEIERAVDRLLACGMLQQVGDGALAATGLGQAVAAYGIAIPTAEDFASWCRARAVADERGHAGFPVVAPFEVLALCALSRDGEMFPLPLTAAERDQRHFAREFAARADIRAETYPPPLRERLTVYGGFNEAAQSALKKALLAELWITPAPTPDIEEAYRTFAGTIGNLAAHFGWLAQALAACAAALGVPDQECRTVRSIAERLPDGVLAEGVPLSRLGVPRTHAPVDRRPCARRLRQRTGRGPRARRRACADTDRPPRSAPSQRRADRGGTACHRSRAVGVVATAAPQGRGDARPND